MTAASKVQKTASDMTPEEIRELKQEHRELSEKLGTFPGVGGRGGQSRSFFPAIDESRNLWSEYESRKDAASKRETLEKIMKLENEQFKAIRTVMTQIQQAQKKANKRIFNNQFDEKSFEEQIRDHNTDRAAVATPTSIEVPGESRTARDRFFNKLNAQLDGLGLLIGQLLELFGGIGMKSNNQLLKEAFEDAAEKLNEKYGKDGYKFEALNRKDGGCSLVATDGKGNPKEMTHEHQQFAQDTANAYLREHTKDKPWNQGLSVKLTGAIAAADSSVDVGGDASLNLAASDKSSITPSGSILDAAATREVDVGPSAAPGG